MSAASLTCPHCQATRMVKNGRIHNGRQNFFLKTPPPRGILAIDGMGLQGIKRVTDIHHTTVMGWVREAGLKLPDVPELESSDEPDVTDLDELQMFVGNKRQKI